MSGITLRQLRAFSAIAHQSSFTRAAAKLGVSQSALTIAIRELEAEVGLRVFDRSTRSVELTQHGAGFLRVADRILDEIDRALDDLKAVAGRQRGSVVISAAASFITYVLVPAVAVMAEKYPNITVRMLENTTTGVSRQVRDGEADIGITTFWSAEDDLETEMLLRDAFGVVVPSGHAIAQASGKLTWRALKGVSLVSLPPGAGVRVLIEQNPEVAALIKSPTYEVSSVSALKPLIERGVGIAALPALAARPLLDGGLVFRPLFRPTIRRELHILKRKGRGLTPAAAQMARIILDELHKLELGQGTEVVASAETIRQFEAG